MPLKTRVWSASRLLLLAVALIVTYFVFAATSMRLALRARDVEVPNLVNRTASEATNLAAVAGLTLRVDDMRRIDPKIEAGHVLVQEPRAGSVTRASHVIKVWLSAGPRATTVPLLVGQTQRTAELDVARDGLAIAGMAEIHSTDYPADTVVAQVPGGRGSAAGVVVLVNRADEGPSYVMPDLIGLHGDQAAEILRAHGFRVAVVASSPYPGVGPGIVLRQTPQAGFQLAQSQPVSLEVSR
jgi:serine/threonine-protein kinase